MSFEYSYQPELGTGFFIVYLAVMLLAFIFTTVCYWRIFEKAGEHGWAILVPFYNFWVQFKIAWGNGAYMFLMLIPFVNFVVGIISNIKLAKAFGRGGAFAAGLIFVPVVFIPLLAFSNSIEYEGV